MKVIPSDLNYLQAKRYGTDKLARRYGQVLAGREEQRVKTFVRRMRGDVLSKQDVNFTGFYSMPKHTTAA